MPEISLEKIKQYRTQIYRSTPELSVKTADEAVEYVNRRGFIFFWPIKGFEMPSLWVAAAGDRPVPDQHDDPGHITWDWKDRLLGQHRWYYGRLLRRRNMMVSLDCLPYFYALSPNYGDPENDYLEQYIQGTITLESKQVYETLLKNGAMDTISLRREAHLNSSGSEPRFNKALDSLMSELKILPVGTSQAGSWHYTFVYDLVPRHFPELQDQARSISEADARFHLLSLYLNSVGAAPFPKIGRLFGWPPVILQKVVDNLVSKDQIVNDCSVQGQKDPFIVLKSLT